MYNHLSSAAVASLVSRFNQADLSFLFAVSSGVEEEIAVHSNTFIEAMNELLNFTPDNAFERSQFARFLGERFLLSENCSPQSRLDALNRLVELAADGEVQLAR